MPLPMQERGAPFGERSHRVGFGWVHDTRLFDRAAPVARQRQNTTRFWPNISTGIPRGARTRWSELLESAAAKVARKIPGSILMVGNISQSGGGRYAVEHLAQLGTGCGYRILRPGVRREALPAIDAGFCSTPKARGTIDGKNVRFDAARNWALVQALISQTQTPVQYVFAYEPLIKAMLEVGKKEGLTREQTQSHSIGIKAAHGGAAARGSHARADFLFQRRSLAGVSGHRVGGGKSFRPRTQGISGESDEMVRRVSDPDATPERLAAAWRMLGLLRAKVGKNALIEALASCVGPGLRRAAGGFRGDSNLCTAGRATLGRRTFDGLTDRPDGLPPTQGSGGSRSETGWRLAGLRQSADSFFGAL